MTSIIVLSGPTASGKSHLAIELAQQLDGEIVSADSMQLYKELNIGVAKPDKHDRASVPHHLVDVMSIHDRVSVHHYKELADAAIANISARNKIPIVVGGTGLYIKALLYGLDDLPSDPILRKKLDEEYDNAANFDNLKLRMSELDSSALVKFANCQRKLIRAMEVKLLTGQSILELQKSSSPALRYRVFGRYLAWNSDDLKSRIRLRSESMLKSGWINECKQLLEQGLLSTPTAHQALGYRLVGEFLSGKYDANVLLDKISTATWQFARRQRTWVKHQMPESSPLIMPCRVSSLILEASQFLSQSNCAE